ncbi:MAG: hypothetical protein IJW51_06615 [Clostridia bacterium]|nr:hypothetical protein [Clostridia bacterium]
MTEKDELTLLARARDLLARAERGEVCHTPFLTPREQKLLARGLGAANACTLQDGGYPAAERKRVFFLPEYITCLEGELRDGLLAEPRAEALCAVSVKGSGYRALSHRDYLGAVLNLGIERDAIGDICVLPTGEAVLFCDRVIADFLFENLTRVARDAVTVAPAVLPPDFDGGRTFAPMSDTVASPRADAVVAALCNLARERAQALFAQGAVELDYEPLEKYDREVPEGATLTVRGHGKFIVRALSDKTKKGRFRLLADRYL